DIMFPEPANTGSASSNISIDGEKHQEIKSTQHVVKPQWLGVKTKELRTDGAHLIGKISTQPYRGYFHDHDQHVLHHLIARGEEPSEWLACIARTHGSNAHEERENHKRQHIFAG